MMIDKEEFICWGDWICWLWQLVLRVWKMIHWIIHCLLQIPLTHILPMNASNARVTPATTTCECPICCSHIMSILLFDVFLVGIIMYVWCHLLCWICI